jgi:hypothetical protein
MMTMTAKLRILAISVALVGATAFAPAATAHVAPTAFSTVCHAPDAYTAFQTDYIKTLVTSVDTLNVQIRNRVHLPAVPDTAVVVESDSSRCAQGLVAYNHEANLENGPATTLYLIRVGSTYVASNPSFPAGEYVAQFVFDSAFTYKATYLK